MSHLGDSQRRSVLASFRHLDELLGDALRTLREAGGEAPFSRHLADAAAPEVAAMEALVRRFQRALLRALDDLGIARPTPEISALRAARTQVLYAEVALEELRAPALRGYGEVSPEAAEEMEALVGELRELLHRMAEELDEAADRPPSIGSAPHR